MFNMKRILVPTDFSPESLLALDWAVMILQNQSQASIVLCHVVPELLAPAGMASGTIDYNKLLDRRVNTVETKLNDLKRHIPKNILVSHVVGKGDIAPEIERLCKQQACDLVVMITHGRRGISRLLHGSTSEQTVRLAPCPVLVLHLNTLSREAVGATSDKAGEGWR